MKIEIKHRFTGSILFKGDYKNIKACIVAAMKSDADLGGAYLGGAYLRDANLGDADLGGAYLSGAKNIIAIEWRGFTLYVQPQKTKIGCQHRTNVEWLEMDKETAVSYGIEEGDFETYRELLKAGIKALEK